MKVSYSQRQYIYNNLKDVLDRRFEELGKKTMKEVYGVTTQTLVRESIYTYSFHKDIAVKERKEKTKVEGKDVEKIFYIFSFPFHLPVTNEKFDISREISKEDFDAHG